jgi:hypothetical protein
MEIESLLLLKLLNGSPLNGFEEKRKSPLSSDGTSFPENLEFESEKTSRSNSDLKAELP